MRGFVSLRGFVSYPGYVVYNKLNSKDATFLCAGISAGIDLSTVHSQCSKNKYRYEEYLELESTIKKLLSVSH